MPTTTAVARSTVTMTAGVRPSHQCCRVFTTGARRKVRKTARATGMKMACAQYRPTTTITPRATPAIVVTVRGNCIRDVPCATAHLFLNQVLFGRRRGRCNSCCAQRRAVGIEEQIVSQSGRTWRPLAATGRFTTKTQRAQRKNDKEEAFFVFLFLCAFVVRLLSGVGDHDPMAD